MESIEGKSGDFVSEALGPPGLFGVFEDDGETGYLYLYEPDGREVFGHLHVYDRSPSLKVEAQDVRVLWSEGYKKVGVLIWGKMRGIIDLGTGQEGRVWLERRNSPGIADTQWLEGFHL
jgi:hypothetical protein